MTRLPISIASTILEDRRREWETLRRQRIVRESLAEQRRKQPAFIHERADEALGFCQCESVRQKGECLGRRFRCQSLVYADPYHITLRIGLNGPFIQTAEFSRRRCPFPASDQKTYWNMLIPRAQGAFAEVGEPLAPFQGCW